MTAEQEVKLDQLSKSVNDLTSELHELKQSRLKSDVEYLGAADVITLAELKATVKVLENYKSQGFKNIQL